jgi:ABC-type polysaccharide/polyol phosphate transport system ATPase subunit
MIARSAGEHIRVIHGRFAVHCVQPAVARADACVEGASKSFGKVSALRDLSLRVDPGEAIAIAGHPQRSSPTAIARVLLLAPTDARTAAGVRLA